MDHSDIILMGVSGSGKSTVGRRVAQALGQPFVEGDDHHPPVNVAKMAAGQALSNADRYDWIAALAQAVNAGPPAVVACSALNEEVRGWIEARFARPVIFVHLCADKAVIAARLAQRSDHFFDPALLDSQFAALDGAEALLSVSVDQEIDVVVVNVLAELDDEAE